LPRSSPYHHYPLHVGGQPPQLLPMPPAGPVGQPEAKAGAISQHQHQALPAQGLPGQQVAQLLPPLLGYAPHPAVEGAGSGAWGRSRREMD
jgi:hypothetical protein